MLDLFQSGNALAMFEVMPKIGLGLVLEHIPGQRDPFAAKHPWYVLVDWEVDNEAAGQALAQRLLEAGLEKGLATRVGQEGMRLSGGQKARLSLLLATLPAPHLLILDEPTNHLDIESREALVEALTAYSGAVILVSHDMHLLSMVADRLWLVKDGHVSVYEEDLQAYRKMLLSSDKPAKQGKGDKPASKPKPKGPSQEQMKALRADVRKCEDRMTKIDDMRDKLAKKLADPVLYQDARKGELETWNKK